MKQSSTRKIVINGLMIALVFLATYFTKIYALVPPPGYINLGDAIIMTTAILLGSKSGFLAGSVGAAFADILSPGGIIYAPVTFIVKGIEGYIVGKIAGSKKLSKKEVVRIAAVLVGALIIPIGYFFGELYFLKIFDNEVFGYAYAIGGLPGNLIQGLANAVIAYPLSTVLIHAGIASFIKNP